MRLFILGMAAAALVTGAGAQETCPAISPVTVTGNLFSPQQEQWLGEFLRDPVLQRVDAVDDPALTGYLNQVMGRLTAVLPPLGFPIHLHLVVTSDTNAYTMVGGETYITRPLISQVRSEDELAGILAHELGHTYAHQVPLGYSDELRANLKVTELGDRADIWNKLNQLITYGETHADRARTPDETREEEAADLAALQIMARAGYDPAALATAFDRLAGLNGKTGSWFANFLAREEDTDTKRFRAMLDGQKSALAGCARQAPIASAADFRRWQDTLIAYRRPKGTAVLPGLQKETPLTPLQESYRQLRFSPDGQYILALDEGGVTVLGREPFQPVLRVEDPDIQISLFSPDSKSLVVQTTDLRVEQWNIASQERTAIHQVVPSVPGCLAATVSATADRMVCFRLKDLSLQLLRVEDGSLVYEQKNMLPQTLQFSPDGRFVLTCCAIAGFGPAAARAVDVQTGKEINLSGAIGEMMPSSLTFLPTGSVLGTSDWQHTTQWEVRKFPTGELERKVKLGAAEFSGIPGSNRLVARPLGNQPAGVFDPAASRGIFLSKTPALDGFGETFVNSNSGGGIDLIQVAGTDFHTIAHWAVPPPPLSEVAAVAASPDLNWIAISQRYHGALWNLSGSGHQLLAPGFDKVSLSGSTAVFATLPTDLQLREARKKPGEIARGDTYTVDLASGNATKMTPAPRPHDGGDLDNGLVFDFAAATKSAPAAFEMSSAADDHVIWRHPSPASKSQLRGEQVAPGFLMSGEAMIAVSLNLENVWKAEAADSPNLLSKLDAVREKDRASWIEILDPQTGRRSGDLVLSPDLDLILERSFQLGDRFFAADAPGRLLVYSLKTGELERTVWRRPAAASEAAGTYLARQGDRKLQLFDASSDTPLAEYSFPTDVLFARFSADGKRFLAVTEDQSAFLFPVAGAKP